MRIFLFETTRTSKSNQRISISKETNVLEIYRGIYVLLTYNTHTCCRPLGIFNIINILSLCLINISCKCTYTIHKRVSNFNCNYLQNEWKSQFNFTLTLHCCTQISKLKGEIGEDADDDVNFAISVWVWISWVFFISAESEMTVCRAVVVVLTCAVAECSILWSGVCILYVQYS